MADEHNKWLDRDAAERLLRGEPLEAVDAATRARAVRLAETLDALALTRDDGGELPGEAAALAAFRTARGSVAEAGAAPLKGAVPAAGARRGTGGARHAAPRGATAPLTLASVPSLHGSTAGETDANANTGTGADADLNAHAGSDVGSVRLGRPTARPVRWGRPVRFGMAAALAGCMLGGVAVAAGTGVLPSPFGGRDEPGPAASVSAAASPEQPLVSPSPGVSGADGGRSGGPVPDGGSGEPGSGTSHDETADRQDPTTTRPGTGGARESDASDKEAWQQGVAENCRQYRDGTLSDAQTERLKDAAKRAPVKKKDRDLDRFCARVLDGADGNSGDDKNDTKGDGKSSGKDGEEDSQNSDGEGGDSGLSGAAPTAAWAPAASADDAPARTLPTTRSPSAPASYSAQPTLP